MRIKKILLFVMSIICCTTFLFPRSASAWIYVGENEAYVFISAVTPLQIQYLSSKPLPCLYPSNSSLTC